MDQIWLSNNRRQIVHNVYCPNINDAIAICEIELKQLDQEQSNYLEVPFEQYHEIHAHFNNSDIIKQGAFTYEQVRHILDAGNIHNLVIDERGCIDFKKEIIGMSTAISFAQSKWNGAERSTAVENAVLTGLTVIGEPFAEEIIEKQIDNLNIVDHIELDEGIASAVKKNGAKAVVKRMASTATKKAMYSSVIAKKAITLLNANVVTGAIVTGVMSSVDIIRAIKNQMSPAQLFKNISKTAASVAGSIIGLIVGGGIGLSIPNVSTTVISLIGGIIGLIIGSILTTTLVKKVLDLFIKDDAVKMLEIFNEELINLVEQYLLNEKELQLVLSDFNEMYNMQEEFRKMYATEDRVAYARTMIEKELNRIVRLRMYLQVPTNEELYEAIKRLV
ncbi:Mu-like prophage protein [Solibacillus silvestris StLB046]|uniref:Mu-like prophage protein n=1 Tax=Solibacillus silvestris (strain StLB046) TaxID=1002809 RepID=F2F008_SOLSS|nr:hypothetical protein [Solibacillus silvestris]OBW56905.1 hypothetical protein A9986_09135 [Solibacillus silvestris]BAK15118.1 Mu-like prophage protein [Solibacillus silvestris StLB046]